ncbi:MAG: hypothetical protein JEZ06_06325 [Anaerolineaceae bacterium]|nr:hypothetical protein [Anaerolineaceae bacterium]
MQTDQISPSHSGYFPNARQRNLPAANNFETALQEELGKDSSLVIRLSAGEIMTRYDVNDATPQEMADLSKELYDNGIINMKEHMLLSFQPELSPQYTRIYGKKPDLTQDKNFIDLWENKLESQKKLNQPQEHIQITQKILEILKALDKVG